VTTPDLKQDTFVGIRAIYRERRYAVLELGRYFVALEDAWRVCLGLASLNADVRDATQAFAQALVEQLDDFADAQSERIAEIAMLYEQYEPSEVEEEQFGRQLRQLFLDSNAQLDSEMAKIRSRLLEAWGRSPVLLAISRLRIESPMELAVAVVQTGGPTALAVYSVHLLVHVIRDPERIGAWLPRLVAGWHMGKAEAERARLDYAESLAELKKQRAIEDASGRLIAAAEKIKELPAAEVTAIGAGDTPDDIVAALSE
jgi:hypothetical protein